MGWSVVSVMLPASSLQRITSCGGGIALVLLDASFDVLVCGAVSSVNPVGVGVSTAHW